MEIINMIYPNKSNKLKTSPMSGNIKLNKLAISLLVLLFSAAIKHNTKLYFHEDLIIKLIDVINTEVWIL